jgi:hypothetical protein
MNAADQPFERTLELILHVGRFSNGRTPGAVCRQSARDVERLPARAFKMVNMPYLACLR